MKWFVRIVVGLLGLVILVVSTIFLSVEYRLRRSHDVPAVEVSIPTDAESIAEGERLGTLLGCNGCHRGDLSGAVLFEEMGMARIVSPNLSTKLAEYSDAELARLIRHGVRPDGSTVMGMPSSGFYHMSDDDLGSVIAWLRTFEPVDNDLPESRVDMMGRVGVLTGMFPVEAERIDHDGPRAVPGSGEYLALNICSECHGLDLHGEKEWGMPDLGAVILSYTPETFAHLLRTGEPASDRTLRLMGEVARYRFVNFRDEEVAALYDYLSQLGPGPAEE